MTLDDQLSALAPLTSGVVARLARYSSPEQQLRQYRHRGSKIPPERLREVARRLRELADTADEIADVAEDLARKAALTTPTTRG